MKALLIAGGGKFGKKALEFAQNLHFHTIIIDKSPNCPASEYVDHKFTRLEGLLDSYNNSTKPKLFLLQKDISIINKLLFDTEIKFKFIIPVVPVHLISLIIKLFLEENGIQIVSDKQSCSKSIKSIKKSILLNHNCKDGVIYLSYAKEDEICPDDCPGPPDYCPNFNRVKPITISKYLKQFFNVSEDFAFFKKECKVIITLHSYQLKPGLGGLKGNEVYKILSHVKKTLHIVKEKEVNLILGTSCNCHGVINFFKSSNSSS